MLPKGFNLNGLERGIRNLVITINRIPEVNKKTTHYGPTTCEGHVYPDICTIPTADGWLYFYKPTLKRKGLIKRINQFCMEYPFFGIVSYQMHENDFLQLGLNTNQSERFSFYDLRAHFEPYENEDRDYSEWSEEEQRAYITRARIRKQRILEGWNKLDGRTKDYIFKNITKDIDSLPYMEDKEESEFMPPSLCYIL